MSEFQHPMPEDMVVPPETPDPIAMLRERIKDFSDTLRLMKDKPLDLESSASLAVKAATLAIGAADNLPTLLDELEQLRTILTSDPKIISMHMEDGKLDVEMQHWAIKAMVCSLAKSLNGGEFNYMTTTAYHPDIGPLEVTLRKVWGTRCPADDIAEIRNIVSEHEPVGADEKTSDVLQKLRSLLDRMTKKPV